MRHPSLIISFATSIFAFSVPAPIKLDSRQTGCFNLSKVTCVGHQMNGALAREAINKACSQIPTCVSGPTVPTNPFLGKVPGYTATITLGSNKQCAWVANWTLAACASLFDDIINTTCAAQWPSTEYQCKFAQKQSVVLWTNFGMQWGVLALLVTTLLSPSTSVARVVVRKY